MLRFSMLIKEFVVWEVLKRQEMPGLMYLNP